MPSQATWTSPPTAEYCPLLAVCTALGFWRHILAGLFSADFHFHLVPLSWKPIKCMVKILFKRQAVLNRSQKESGSSCSFQWCHPRGFSCDCLSNSYKPWRGVVTAHILFRRPRPTVNGCNITPPTRTQTSEQECNDLTASWGGRQHRDPAALPNLLLRNSVILKIGKTCVEIYGTLPRFFENALESEIRSVLRRPERKPHWVSALVQLFLGIFFSMYLAYIFPAESRSDASVISAFFSCLLGIRMIIPVFQSSDAFTEQQTTWHTQASERTLRFKVFSISVRISLQNAACSVVTARKTSSAIMVLSSPKCTSSKGRGSG